MKQQLKKWMAWLLFGTACLLGGCSATEGSSKDIPRSEGSQSPVEMADTENSMGRYLEYELTLPEELTSVASFPRIFMQRLHSGEMVIVEELSGMYLSSDEGETWTRQELPWLLELSANAYISQVALSPDGAMAVIYSPFGEEADNVESEYDPEYLYISPDGYQTQIPLEMQNGYLHQFFFDESGSLYGCGLDGSVYEIHPDSGTAKKLFATEGLAEDVCFTGNYMIVIATGEVAVYDMAAQVLAEKDTVLEDFIMENVGGQIGANADGHSVAVTGGEQENVIYFAMKQGLYRHVVGGSVIEQVADGTLTSLGDPAMLLQAMELLPDNEFLILYDQARIYRYAYDASVPTVPEEEVCVYSLYDDYNIRQAISLFQKQNPEGYVRYEVGISEEGGVTAEDAVKNLNTKLMSGDGPDILVLDQLPVDSYIEKGILADISSLVEQMNGENAMFGNIVEAFREDGQLHMLPVRFRLPMLVGDAETLEQVTDLRTLADVLENLRKENPEGSLIGLRTEEEVLYTLGMASSGAWINEQGQIDQEMLAEFIEDASRIYQAETAGFDEAELREYTENHLEKWSTDVTGKGHYYANVSTSAIDIAMGTQKLGTGVTNGMDFDFNIISTLVMQENHFTYSSMKGQVENCFIPQTLAGICSKSAKNEKAVEFFRFLFEKELQEIPLPDGFPVHQGAFEQLAESPRSESNGDDAGVMVMSESGSENVFSLDIRWVSEEDFARLKKMVQSVEEACMADTAILQAVYEVGPKALNGTASVEDAVAEIVKKAAVYLAE